jgi:hypothetical protein
MAYNYLELVNEVNRRLNEVELTSSNFASAAGQYGQIKDAVNAAIRHINHEEFNWPWNHVQAEEVLTPGVSRYGYPYDVKVIDMDSFRIKRDSDLNVETVKLKKLDYKEYLDKYVDYEYNSNTNIRSTPSMVSRAPSQEFIVVVPPDKAYELIYEYYRNPVDLELHSDVPTVPQEFRHIIVDGAMHYAYNFRGDAQQGSISDSRFREGIKFMRTLYINSNDYIRSTVINNTYNNVTNYRVM